MVKVVISPDVFCYSRKLYWVGGYLMVPLHFVFNGWGMGVVVIGQFLPIISNTDVCFFVVLLVRGLK